MTILFFLLFLSLAYTILALHHALSPLIGSGSLSSGNEDDPFPSKQEPSPLSPDEETKIRGMARELCDLRKKGKARSEDEENRMDALTLELESVAIREAQDGTEQRRQEP